jgi:hypothetical protein
MALSTYAELKASVATWLKREDMTTAIIDCVALAEADIRKDVRMQAMETYTSGTLTGETLAQPTGFLEARRITVGSDIYRYVTPEVYTAMSEAGNVSKVFTNIGTSIYILNGASGDAYTLLYWKAFTAFSADGDTNSLLTTEPMVYLAASLRHANIYAVDDVSAQKWGLIYADTVARLNQREKSAMVSGSALQIRTAVTE